MNPQEVQNFLRSFRSLSVDVTLTAESKGWMIGKSKMKDWRAAIRNWEKNEYSKPKEKGIERYKLLN